jgi:hypothetical protein
MNNIRGPATHDLHKTCQRRITGTTCTDGHPRPRRPTIMLDGPQRIRVNVGRPTRASEFHDVYEADRPAAADSGHDSSPLSHRLSRLWNRLSGVPSNSPSRTSSRNESLGVSLPPTEPHDDGPRDSDSDRGNHASSSASSSVSLENVETLGSPPVRDGSPWRLASLSRWSQSRKGKQRASLNGSPRPTRTRGMANIGSDVLGKGQAEDVDEGVGMVEEGGLGELTES